MSTKHGGEFVAWGIRRKGRIEIVGAGLSLLEGSYLGFEVHVRSTFKTCQHRCRPKGLGWSYPVVRVLSIRLVSASNCTKPSAQLSLRAFRACSRYLSLLLPYSSIVLTHSHPPLSLSFHRLTRLSPVLTASTLPLRLQLTRHAAASTLRTVDFQSPMTC